MFVKCNKAGNWICLESTRENSLFYIAAESIAKIPNKTINANIQEAADRAGYDEIDLIIDGIDAVSAKELVQDMVQKLFHPEGSKGK
jgi:hypothetical protein